VQEVVLFYYMIMN